MRLYPALLVLVLLFASACGGPGPQAKGPFYDTQVVRQPNVDEMHFRALRAELPKRLGKTRVELEAASGARTNVDPAQLPPAAAQGLWLAVESGDSAGVELDLLVRLPDDSRIPVTVRRGPAWIVRPAAGKVRFPRGNPDALSARWGIGSLTSDGATWSPRALEVADLALARLSPAERKVLAGVPFIRRPRGERADLGALYVQNTCAAQVLVFDSALHADADQFVGEPEAPLQSSARTFLHEFGHALHNHPGREAWCKIDRAQRALAQRVTELNRRGQRFNARPESARRGPDAQREASSLGAEVEAVERTGKTLKADARRALALVERGPVLEAYARALGGGSAPTRYGTVSLAESFAESFSLFRTDPAALRRLVPTVSAFFERGEHLRAMSPPGT
jgi:hypothetical protein